MVRLAGVCPHPGRAVILAEIFAAPPCLFSARNIETQPPTRTHCTGIATGAIAAGAAATVGVVMATGIGIAGVWLILDSPR